MIAYFDVLRQHQVTDTGGPNPIQEGRRAPKQEGLFPEEETIGRASVICAYTIGHWHALEYGSRTLCRGSLHRARLLRAAPGEWRYNRPERRQGLPPGSHDRQRPSTAPLCPWMLSSVLQEFTHGLAYQGRDRGERPFGYFRQRLCLRIRQPDDCSFHVSMLNQRLNRSDRPSVPFVPLKALSMTIEERIPTLPFPDGRPCTARLLSKGRQSVDYFNRFDTGGPSYGEGSGPLTRLRT